MRNILVVTGIIIAFGMVFSACLEEEPGRDRDDKLDQDQIEEICDEACDIITDLCDVSKGDCRDECEKNIEDLSSSEIDDALDCLHDADSCEDTEKCRDGDEEESIEDMLAACDDYDQTDVTADNACDYVVCAFAAGYNACVDAGADCSYMTDCAETYIDCVCPDGSMSTDAASLSDCGTDYTTCITDGMPVVD